MAIGSALLGAGVAMVSYDRHVRSKAHPNMDDSTLDGLQLRSTDQSYTRTENILRNLRECECFVLDNSLRETTVASIFGHTIQGKYRILEAIRKAGMKHIILGAFGPTRRVDEGFIMSLCDKKQLRDDEHYWAFSEFKDADAPWFEGARSVEEASSAEDAPPYGLKLCAKLGIPNAVIELDLIQLWSSPAGVQGLCIEMRERVAWCKKHLRADSRVVFNLRDFQLAWPKHPERVLEALRAASTHTRHTLFTCLSTY